MPDHLEELRIDGEIRKSVASSDPFAAAVRATRMPTLITDPRQPDNPIVFVNDAFHRLTGFARGECLGRNCRFLQGPETDAATVARIREAIDRREAIETEILNYRKDGSTFWNRVLVSPVFDDGGELVFFFASQFDVTHERERLAAVTRARDELETKIESRLADLRESEERLRFILKSGRFGFWTLNLQTFELVSSETCRRTFGRGESDLFTFDDLAAAIHPGDVDRWREAMREATLKPEGEFGIEYRIATPDGSQRWVEIRGQVKRDADGTPRSMAGVSLDISDRRRADEHRELLAGELAHRVKNTLANVQSIIGQTLQNAPSLEEGRRVLTGRVAALAAAHEILLREEWKAVDLHDLLAVVLEPFGGTAGGRIVVEGPSLLLRPRVATSLSLALHELATNASKYGALSVAAGTVGIRWEIGEGPEATFRLSWRERGGPVVVPSERKGFGSRVLTRALPQELDGQAALRPLPDGIAFDVQAPLHALRQG